MLCSQFKIHIVCCTDSTLMLS